MNVYDFDGTIYDGDSSIDFFKFVLKKEPIILKRLLKVAEGSVLYIVKVIDKKSLKEHFFSFLDLIDGEKYANLFWIEHKDRICEWYRNQQRDDDVIISASPKFLLAPICKELGIQYLLASDVDIHTGKFQSRNCRGTEKVRALLEKFPDCHIEEFYSDSESDLPLALMAEKAFFIENQHITDWTFDDKTSTPRKLFTIRKLLRKHQLILKYLVFGVLTTLINVLAYLLFYNEFGISNSISTILAWLFAVTFALLTNKTSVFNSKRFDRKTLAHEIPRFLGARVVTGLIDTMIMYLSVDILHLNAIFWKLVSNVIVIILNYFASKSYVFRKQ